MRQYLDLLDRALESEGGNLIGANHWRAEDVRPPYDELGDNVISLRNRRTEDIRRQYGVSEARLSDEIGSSNRTGVNALRLFAPQLRFDLRRGFPLLTTKKLHFHSIVHELLWFIRGETNIAYLKDNGVRIWNEWADDNGDLGPVYGSQWRRWRGADGEIDQLANVVEEIRNNPQSRRLIVSAWNAGEIDKMALPPCHLLFQFVVLNGSLNCQMYQRSADLFLGVPFNIASYALLTHLVAEVTGLQPGELVITFGDAHLYVNHIEQARLQLQRTPGELPTLQLTHRDDLFAFTYDDIRLLHYSAQPHIAAPVAV